VQELERRLCGQPAAEEGLVHAVPGKRIDEPGCVADKQNTPLDGPPRRPTHRQPLPAQIANVRLVDLEGSAKLAEPLA
jgi:hypothetical protein